jgi:hypothetical protein
MPAAAACYKWRVQATSGTQCCCAAMCCARWPHLQPQKQLHVLHPRQQAQQRVHLCQADSPKSTCCNDGVTRVGRACGGASLRCLWQLQHQVQLGVAVCLRTVAQGGPRRSRACRRPADKHGAAGSTLPSQDRQRRPFACTCARASGAQCQCNKPSRGTPDGTDPSCLHIRGPLGSGAQCSPFGPKKPRRSRRLTPRHSSSIDT